MSHGARGLAKASTAALVIAGVGGATGAQAAVPSVPDVTLEYTCKYPIVDKQPLSIKVSSNIPTKAVLRVNQPAFQINAVATAGGDTARAINTLNAYSIEGSSEAFADLEFPDGFIQEDLFVPLVVEPWIRPNSDPVTGNLVLTAKGDTPSVQLEPVGNALIRLDRITLNLVAKGQTGNIINVRKLTTDFDGNPVVPADSTPNDFNVYCKLNAGQSNLIATIEVVNSLNTPPSKVAGLKSTAKSTTSVDLAWDAASDPDAGDSIKEYRVFQGATLVKTVAAPATSVKVDGLTPNTDYSFTVVAVDTAGPDAGPASDALPVKTDPIPDPVNTAPSKVGGLKTTAKSTDSVDLAWDAASDSDAGDSIKEYRVFQGANLVKTVAAPATSVKVDGLAPNTDYSFTVVAVDNAGPLAGAASDALPVKTDPIPDPVNTAPGKVAGLKSTAKSTTSVDLAWDAASDPDAGDSIKEYRVFQGATLVKTVAAPATSVKVDGLTPNTDYSFTVVAVDNGGPVAGPASDALPVKTDPIPDPVNTAPGKVAGLKSTAKSTTSVDLAWDAASDPDAGDSIKEYRVFQGATQVKTVAAPATSVKVDGLTPNTDYSFTVVAVDNGGPVAGPASDALPVKTDPIPDPVNTPPTVPTALKVGAVTSSTIALSWAASTDDAKVAGYNVYSNGTKIGTSATPSFTATGLAPSTKYTFTVDAFDEPGLTSAKSAGVDGTTGPKVEPGVCPEGFACQGYTLAGSTQLNTLTRGSLPLKGGIDAALDPSNGKFTADLVLNPTSGRLTALSFLPITVKVAFAPSGKTTGTIDDANILRSKSLVRIKITEVKLFGAIPLAGGNGCQTKSLSEINLTSTKAFEIFKGGTLKGTYAISDLNGCGALNGLVSPLTAGKGNTISLDLTPKA